MNEILHTTLRDLLPAYALDALDEEQMEVADHLAVCPQCRAELAALRETLGALAFSAPAALPVPAVKAALLDRVARTPHPPGSQESVATLYDRETDNVMPPRPHALPGGGGGRFRRARLALSAVAAVLVLSLLGWASLTQVQLRQERARNQELAAQTEQFALVNTLLNKPGSAFPVSGPKVADYGLPAAGYVYVDPASNVGLMLTYWLPQIGADQRFQVWLVTPDGQRDSGGLFAADARGNANVIINAPAPFAKYKSVGVTVEPAAGSPGPTSPRVCGGDIR